MPSVLRILDANANRAREALRVMEEAARFILNDESLCTALKNLRHDFSRTIAAIPGLEANRDTPGDVGATIKTVSEQKRESVADVVIAAGKRLSEALRAVEEYGKTLGSTKTPSPMARSLPGGEPSGYEPSGGEPSKYPSGDQSEILSSFPATIERLRYLGYDIEKRLTRAMGCGMRKQWRLCILLTRDLCKPHDWSHVLDECLAAGVDCIQIREKTLDAGPLLEHAKEVVARCRGKASVIINDRPDIALLSGADGVHLGQTDLPCTEVRKLTGRQLLIGVSTSTLDEAKRALQDGADYCGIGPMFPTTTKKKDHIAGPACLREYLAWDKLPHLAIGGINADNLPELIAVGVKGIAVSGAVCAAEDVREAATELMARRGEAGA